MTTHTVESTKDTVRSGYLDPTAQPVATIVPGDTVRYPNTWTHWGNEATFGMTFADREPLRHRYPNGPYSMLGPVEVAGAEPGDVVECSITRLRTIGWGWNSFPLGVGALGAVERGQRLATALTATPVVLPRRMSEVKLQTY